MRVQLWIIYHALSQIAFFLFPVRGFLSFVPELWLMGSLRRLFWIRVYIWLKIVWKYSVSVSVIFM